MRPPHKLLKPLWVLCRDCRFVWVAAFQPAPVSEVTKAMQDNCQCPKCGGAGYLANQSDGELLERAGADCRIVADGEGTT